MKLTKKMKRFIPLIIVLIIGYVIWGLLGFPRDFDLVSTKILSVLTFLGALFTVVKGIKDVFFDNSSKSSVEISSDSENPLVVQIADSKKEPSLLETKSDSLKKIRAFGPIITREQIADDVTKVLGSKSDLFWKEIDSNPKGIPFSLAKNGFWLEGLVLVFEQNNWSIPKNNGRVLEKILLNQWTVEKLEINSTVSLDILQRQLAILSLKNFPAEQYPKSYSGRIYSPYSSYERLVESIGTEASPERLKFSRILLNLFLAPFSLLKVLITLPFTGMERIIGYFVATNRAPDFFSYRLESIWYKYEKFKLRTRRFFDSFNTRKIRNMRRGKMIIESGDVTGILSTDGEHISFTEEYWRDYFTAWQVVHTKSMDAFLSKYVDDRYRRRYPSQGDKIAIMISGLCETPSDSIERVLSYDPIAASKCLLTLDDIPSDIQEGLKQRMLASIVENLKSVPSDGNTGFCLDSIRAMRSLSDNPFYAKVALDKIPEIYHYERRKDAVKLVASFGPPVFDSLQEKLTTEDPSFLRNILIAFGELGNKKAIPLLLDLLETSKHVDVRIMSAVVLAICFKDKAGIRELEKYLLFEYPDWEQGSPWSDLDVFGEDAIAFGLDVLVKASKTLDSKHNDFRWPRMQSSFLKTLRRYKFNSNVETVLSEHLDKPHLKVFLIEALGNIGIRESIPRLIPFLHEGDDYVRSKAMDALAKIAGEDVCSELTGLLYAENVHLVKDAIISLGDLKCLKSIPAIIEQLNSDKTEEFYPGDGGYPIALYAVDALIKIGKTIREEQNPNQAQKTAANVCFVAATEWCNDHLGNRSLVRGSQDLTYEALFRLIFNIQTKDAHNYYSAWLTEHPEDIIG
jgi:hypothetical protein